MAATWLSSLAGVWSRHLSSSLFRNPNRFTPLIRINSFPLPQNPSRWFSSNTLSPHNSIKTPMQSSMASLPEIQRTQIDKESPAMVSCATDFKATLHFSTYNSDGAPLNQFSKPCPSPSYLSQPFVLSACRDLLLLKDSDDTFLCNIATQELITLPNLPGQYNSNYVIGLGYVPFTKEFKLLANPDRLESSFNVLTLGSYRWRHVEPPPFEVEGYGDAFVNGAIHLRSKRRSDVTAKGIIHLRPVNDDRIATFNLEREEWGSIVGPPVPFTPRIPMMELSRCLCMVAKGSYSIRIWLLKDYDNGSWVKECMIPLSALNHRYPRLVTPLAIQDDGKILVQVDRHDSLHLYDPETKSSRQINLLEGFDTSNLIHFDVKVFTSLSLR